MKTKEQKIERAKLRREKRKQHREMLKCTRPRYSTCRTCGGRAQWCSCCNMWSCHDCDPYGTCMCN